MLECAMPAADTGYSISLAEKQIMENPVYILAHDVGTTGNKSCLYRIAGQSKWWIRTSSNILF
jgi:hypothetical protein